MAVNKEKEKQAALAAKAAYMRQWRKRNPQKSSEYSMRYWMKKAQQVQNTEAPDHQERRPNQPE